MARTFTPITKIVTGSVASNTITLSSLPQTFTDLMIHGRVKLAGNSEIYLRINSDSSSTYNWQDMYTGPGAGAAINAGYNRIAIGSSSAYFVHFELFIPNYTSSAQKTILSRSSDLYNGTSHFAISCWETTSAVTAINIIGNSQSISAGATFEIYGIKAA